MNVVAVQGLKGGVGTTTVVANLAVAISAQKLPVLAIDLCPQNSLRLHFGMELADESGFARQIAVQQPWFEAAYQSQQGINFLPFGQDIDNYSVDAFTHYVGKHPQWLSQWLDRLELDPSIWVLIDCPLYPFELTKTVLSIADIGLLVANPDALNYTTLRAENCPMHQPQGDNGKQLLLLNKYSPALNLERDIVSLIKVDFAPELLPIIIHQDECLREAFAYKKSVLEFAATSQSAQDFSLIALWLTARQARLALQAEQASREAGV